MSEPVRLLTSSFTTTLVITPKGFQFEVQLAGSERPGIMVESPDCLLIRKHGPGIELSIVTPSQQVSGPKE